MGAGQSGVLPPLVASYAGDATHERRALIGGGSATYDRVTQSLLREIIGQPAYIRTLDAEESRFQGNAAPLRNVSR